jgi:hypothetical protein
MTVPTVATYSVAALVAAHTSFRDLIDSGVGAGFISVRGADDALLATIPLDIPSGAVNGLTGQLVFSMAGPDESAEASGAAAYVEFCDSSGAVHLALPAEAGEAPVPGKVVFGTLTIVAGGPVEVISATVG